MWYSASLMFKDVRTPPVLKDGPLWEERIRLVEASTEEEATTRAEHLGRSIEHCFETEGGSLTWKLERVEVREILSDKLEHGTEVFYRYLRESEALSLLTPFED